MTNINEEFESENLTSSATGAEEVVFENTLRPSELKDFVGQEQIKQNLNISIQAAKKRKSPPSADQVHNLDAKYMCNLSLSTINSVNI